MLAHFLRKLSLFFFVLLLACPAWAAVYVKADATGANNGTSWADAYTDLQTALTNTASGEIWVAAGTYYPGATGNVDATFQLKNNVALYGGFNGAETALDQRNWTANVTTLSGDINHDDAYGSPTWYDYGDGFRGYTGNSLHVTTGSNTDASAVLDGFTVKAGSTGASLTGDLYAGYGLGMLVLNGSPTVRNCVFTRHLTSGSGAGMYLSNASPVIEASSFIENYAGYGGAGIYSASSASSLTLTDVAFISNTIKNFFDAAGGGVAFHGTGALTITRSRFENNQALVYYAVQDYANYGAGVYVSGGSFTIRDSIFTGNSAMFGAGLYAWTGGSVINSVFMNNSVYPVQFVTTGETNGNVGAGIGAYGFSSANISVINSVLANNTAGEGGGVAAYGLANADIRNSILWNNTATGANITQRAAQVTGNFNVDYSTVQGILSDPTAPGPFPGASESDPQFVNLALNDFHLQATSPAIDSGNNASVPGTTLTDLDGNARRADVAGVPDTGSGTAPLVDRGVYEYGSVPPAQTTDVSLTVRDSPDPVTTNTTLTYTITVSNLGTVAAANVSVTDILPANVSITSATTTQGSCVRGTTTVCTIGTLLGGSSVTVTIKVKPTVAGTLTNTASVTTSSVETDLANNSALTLTTANAPVPKCGGGTASITAIAVDEKNFPVVGASAKITGPNGCVSTATVNATTGKAQFKKLLTGSYTVTPVKAGCPWAPPSAAVTLGTTASVTFVGDGCN